MTQHGEVAAALKVWRDGLVNLSGVNRLIKFRASKTGAVFFDAPSPQTILSTLTSGTEWRIEGTANTGEETGVVDLYKERPAAKVLDGALLRGDVLRSPRADDELGPVLRNLMRRANAEFLDRGLSVLYLAFGMLHWKDVDDTAMASPLLLVPVTLHSAGPKATPTLGPGEDDTVFNPGLLLRMREMGVTLPDIEDTTSINLGDLFTAVTEAVSEYDGWEVKPTVVLSSFSFHKEAMYRDLMENEEAVLGHPIVRALGTKDPAQQSTEFVFEPIEPGDIDFAAPPEETPLVLDADSSQRAAVAAAVAGRSFVMDGPPGTGKSQTIANTIGALLHAGKSVLFVSEKAAALEVVRNRLADAGLENYLLELHSHKASRKEVATALASALDNVPVPPKAMDGLRRSSVAEQRQRLNEYAEAMNTVREPLDMSLHQVLGILANLAHVPAAPVPETPPADLTQSGYQSIQQTAVRLERAWRPAEQGNTYLWRDVQDASSLDIRLYQADSTLEELHGVTSINTDLAVAFDLTQPSDATRLVALLDAQHHRPHGTLHEWLTTVEWDALIDLRRDLADNITAVVTAETAFVTAYGVPWTRVPEPADLPDAQNLPDLNPSALDLDHVDAVTADRVATEFETLANRLTERVNSLSGLAHRLGLPDVTTYEDADKVIGLINIGFRQPRPARTWLTRDGLAAAKNSLQSLSTAVADLRDTETAATAYFTFDALHAPVGELHERFTHHHKGLKKLSGEYRTDKKTVAALLRETITVEDGIQHLPLAIAWAKAAADFNNLASQYAPALDTYWQGINTDFATITRGLKVADAAYYLMPPSGPTPELSDYLTDGEPPTGYQTLVDDIAQDLQTWKGSLQPAPALTGRPELLLQPIATSIAWLTDHVGPLRTAAQRTRVVDAATGTPRTFADTNTLLRQRTETARHRAQFDANTESFIAAFADHYQGVETDLRLLDEAIGWAEQVRTIAGRPLVDNQTKALAESRHTDNLRESLNKWTRARDRIIEAFATTRRADLIAELDDYRNAPDFIADLRDDSTGQEEWFAYNEAREQLAALGLDTAIDFCVDQRVPAHQVPAVVERALLRAWADNTIQNDRRVRPLRSEEHTALVEEYRNLDKQLILNATSDIIRSANTRRPSATGVGEPGVIRREGMKKTRHMPVRELIARTRNTSLAIKPCFMMSPLAVSQYLPADMNFDVVIFDEASQVTPGDAINCVYRGKALILAGDDKQLPPTSFFERVVDEDGDDETDIADFQSVLELAKGCGAFNNLSLKWHYRSRHEDLIAFSNQKFYDGKLVTYPSAQSEGPAVGVEFFHAHGMYRRGGGADNPGEAAKVAERVIDHFTNRPKLTLGVVTFSVAQADAIYDALDKARETRRDLDRFFDNDNRLDAFFIKSLESVQGDERDVIIFSIGYGPDEAGKVTTNFGVLNKPKGWRRLNVAITRARQRVEVIASLRAGNIPPSENESVEHLRAYLDYAERGQQALAIDLGPSGLGPDSPFEESVINTIRNWGYIIEPQVGTAGFRIDIGVRHPAHPGTFALGVECDGYQYHSAPAARDRDRLRDEVLRGLGWRLHRLWGTAWYRNREREENRLRTAIEEAIHADNAADNTYERLQRPAVLTEEVDHYSTPPWTTPYTTAQVKRLPRWTDPADQGSRFDMTQAMVDMAFAEGPVHIDLIHQRVRAAWDIGRISYKVRDNIDAAIHLAEVTREGDFIDLPDRPVDQVRVPANDVARKIDWVHNDELRLAFTFLLRDAGATPRDDLIVAVSRVFGWSRTGTDIGRRLNDTLDDLLNSGAVTSSDDHINLPGQ